MSSAIMARVIDRHLSIFSSDVGATGKLPASPPGGRNLRIFAKIR
jgi:hypothetical protein